MNLGPPSYRGWCTTTVPPVLRYKSVDYNIIPTIPTPVHPIPTYLCHSRVIRITPEHPMPLPNPLAPSQVNLRLSNALPNTLTPLCLVDAFPTRHSFDLSLSSCQVDSRHPHSFPTQCPSTFSLLASSPFPTFHRSCNCSRAKPDHIPPSLDAS